jgi:hypothetical protein
VKRIEVCFIYTYEDSMMKPPNTVWKGAGGEGKLKYNERGELVQSTMCIPMELTQ